ncbi:helicase-associated domain-containing protein [uncultured Microbacterium sp.]|uniref:helicase-associated domain-containing protein n=1 Tax=uncultured Microbacterium sp. TaxID=191216 RepID=UPI0025CC4DF2|nr:helicase-associated domain-containing protein [uncultured Microbacterium sp.]
MSTHARLIAEALSARADVDLAQLFDRREVRPDVPWDDFFDAAEGLLDAASLGRILPRLTRAEAAALSRAARGEDPGDPAASLEALALLSPSGSVPPPVATAVAAREDVSDDAGTSAPAPADADVSARAAERAFTSVATLADALLLAEETPLTLLAGGTVGLSERRRLIERGLPDDAALLDDLLTLGAAAGLLRPTDRSLRLSPEGAAWLRLPGPRRWSALVEGFRAALPAALRTEAGGWIPIAGWAGEHPWDPSWPARAEGLLREARLLGLVADTGEETPWATAARRGESPDPAALAGFVPAEVDRIFLQNDLTAIAPGPLLPALDLRLRGMAARESASQASSYRFTADTLSGALSAGETAEGITAFLEGISLTGVPQPLRYLLAQSAARHGQVRVSTDADSGRTRVRADDPHLLQAIGIDQALRPLGLVREEDSLTTRVNRDTVFWALSDEHYPAALVDRDGGVERPLRTLADPAPVLRPATESYATLIARLRDARGVDAETAWLERELEHAAKQRAVIAVEVAMPDGSSRELVLEVTGFGGGRLRGRDRAGDVERTLPIRSIRATRPVGASPE